MSFLKKKIIKHHEVLNHHSPSTTTPEYRKDSIENNDNVKTEAIKEEEPMSHNQENTEISTKIPKNWKKTTTYATSQSSPKSSSSVSSSQQPDSPWELEKENHHVARSNRKTSPTKNIAINYGKAILSFATSHIAIQYIMDQVENTEIDLVEFIAFLHKVKGGLKSMWTFKELLTVNKKKDDKKAAACKRVFQKICEIFVKYFSVNWITHSKLDYKLVYLKYRFSMLRRIRNPEMFTYITHGH